jgi:hypothetical protein
MILLASMFFCFAFGRCHWIFIWLALDLALAFLPEQLDQKGVGIEGRS